jgi:predicted dehydrogenase
MKVGILGAGGMAQYHYTGFKKAGAEVAAVADLSTRAASAFAEPRNIGEVYDSLPSMLKGSPDIEAISVITPNKFHKENIIEALLAGKHVYCEKPPTLNAAEMTECLEAAKKAGKILMFDFNNRARPESQAIMRNIKAGKIGRINSAQAIWARRNGIPGAGGWFTNKAIAGGGPVLDLLHMLDLALYFMGYPEPANLLARTYDDFMGDPDFRGAWGQSMTGGVANVETASHAFLTFKTGQCLFIRNSWAEMNEREVVSVVFQGTKAGGKVERVFGVDGIDETAQDTCMLFTRENGNHVDITIKHEMDESMGRISSAINFIHTIEGKAEPLNTPEEALSLMRIIDAIYASSASGKAVEF